MEASKSSEIKPFPKALMANWMQTPSSTSTPSLKDYSKNQKDAVEKHRV